MSMILDALSRAEKERQAENAIGLDTARYATSSTIKEDRFKKWVLIALVANFALIILLTLGYIWKTYVHETPNLSELVDNEQTTVMEAVVTEQHSTNSVSPIADQPLENKTDQQPELSSIDLSGESNKTQPAASLLDETKVKVNQTKKAPIQKPIKSIVKKIPPVQYSSKPLSAPTQKSKPTVASVSAGVEKQRIANTNSSNYTRLSDVPISERSKLSQYEVNVHVYDDSGQASFVLINMVKYRQGDQLPGGGAIVSAIVPEGVVIDYGSGKALIERTQ
ncbi:MAG: general secretion pathway protein GspB [Gammaproteobacteria bacterium]